MFVNPSEICKEIDQKHGLINSQENNPEITLKHLVHTDLHT